MATSDGTKWRKVTGHRDRHRRGRPRPSPRDDSDIFGVPLPRVRSHLWPVGQGYLVDDRSLEIVQVAR